MGRRVDLAWLAAGLPTTCTEHANRIVHIIALLHDHAATIIKSSPRYHDHAVPEVNLQVQNLQPRSVKSSRSTCSMELLNGTPASTRPTTGDLPACLELQQLQSGGFLAS